jgi:hypothetical protein
MVVNANVQAPSSPILEGRTSTLDTPIATSSTPPLSPTLALPAEAELSSDDYAMIGTKPLKTSLRHKQQRSVQDNLVGKMTTSKKDAER